MSKITNMATVRTFEVHNETFNVILMRNELVEIMHRNGSLNNVMIIFY
jgi:hypothetical protein